MCAVRNGSVRKTSSCLSESHSQLDPYLFFSTFSIFVGGKKKFPFWMRRIFFVDSLCRHSFIDFFHWISSSSIYIRQLNKISRNRMPKKEKKCREDGGTRFVTGTTWWSVGMDREAKERPRPSREFKLMNELDWTRSTIRFSRPRYDMQVEDTRAAEDFLDFRSTRLGPMISYCPLVYIIRRRCCCSF